MAEQVSATAVIGILIGFLVVGTIGVFIGDQLISSTGLTGAVTSSIVTITTTGNTVVPADATLADIRVVGSGGGGGGGSNYTAKGGTAGAAGTSSTWTGVEVTPGATYSVIIGEHGVGVLGTAPEGMNGTAGYACNITIGAFIYNAAGGTFGINGSSTATPAKNGMPGNAGYGALVLATAPAIVTNTTDPSYIAGTNGTVAAGYGAGGAGSGAGDATHRSAGGDGAPGVVEMTYYTNGLHSSQASVIETFQLGVLLCKIIIIVSIASIVFTLLQRTGLIPKFGNDFGGGGM